MPLSIPPRPLSQEEFNKRWKKGARTLKDLDPDFWRWKQTSEKMLVLQAVILTIGSILFLIVFISILIT